MNFFTIKFIIISLFIIRFSYAQHEEADRCVSHARGILEYVYNGNIRKAKEEKNKYCNNSSPESQLIQAHITRWEYLPIYEKDQDILKQYLSPLLAISQSETLETEYQEFIKINSFLLLAEFYYNKKETLNAINFGGKAYSMIKPKLEVDELSNEWLLITGLYNYFYSYYLNKGMAYNSLLFFFKKGDKEKGLEQLKTASATPSIVQAESLIYLSHIYLRIENEANSALNYAEKLVKRYPENLKFYEFYIEASIASGKLDASVKFLVKKLINSELIYYKKYGVTYNALLKQYIEPEKKASELKSAVKFILDNGGGNHLLSLLYKQLATIPGYRKKYTTKLLEKKVYDFELTII